MWLPILKHLQACISNCVKQHRFFFASRFHAARKRAARAAVVRQEALDMVANQPSVSKRPVGRIVDVSQLTIRRVMKGERWHPYHFQINQTLIGASFLVA